jgi:dolichyldiphosphatase
MSKGLEITFIDTFLSVLTLTGDPIGFVLAFISLTPFAVFIAFFTLLIFKKELDTLLFLCGQLLNEVLNIVLKNVIREPRPDKHVKFDQTIKTYGMPSQHSQFQAFFTFHCILFILLRMQHKPWYFRYPLVLLLSSSLTMVVYSRVYLEYHYWSQVLVGIIVGFVWASIWFWFEYNFFEPRFFNDIISL